MTDALPFSPNTQLYLLAAAALVAVLLLTVLINPRLVLRSRRTAASPEPAETSEALGDVETTDEVPMPFDETDTTHGTLPDGGKQVPERAEEADFAAAPDLDGEAPASQSDTAASGVLEAVEPVAQKPRRRGKLSRRRPEPAEIPAGRWLYRPGDLVSGLDAQAPTAPAVDDGEFLVVATTSFQVVPDPVTDDPAEDPTDADEVGAPTTETVDEPEYDEAPELEDLVDDEYSEDYFGSDPADADYADEPAGHLPPAAAFPAEDRPLELYGDEPVAEPAADAVDEHVDLVQDAVEVPVEDADEADAPAVDVAADAADQDTDDVNDMGVAGEDDAVAFEEEVAEPEPADTRTRGWFGRRQQKRREQQAAAERAEAAAQAEYRLLLAQHDRIREEAAEAAVHSPAAKGVAATAVTVSTATDKAASSATLNVTRPAAEISSTLPEPLPPVLRSQSPAPASRPTPTQD